jgi:N-acylglucosamine-6-phosphate 2-epimerase
MTDSVLQGLRGGLIVSCQAYPGDPLRQRGVMPLFARAAEQAGAVAVRLEGLEDVRDAARVLQIPIVGIVKRGPGPVEITPTFEDCRDLIDAGARVVALDGTRRTRPDALGLGEVVQRIRDYADVLVMADCGSVEDAGAAMLAGVDILSTTLAGYTADRAANDGPDLAFVRELVASGELPVVAEGRIWTPEQARVALDAGAYAVCVGSAITHPGRLTRRFLRALS